MLLRLAQAAGVPTTARMQVQRQVGELMKGRIVVGHALSNDFKVRAPLLGEGVQRRLLLLRWTACQPPVLHRR